jgi:hypothetical protein
MLFVNLLKETKRRRKYEVILNRVKKKNKLIKIYHVIEVIIIGDKPDPTIQAPAYFPK